MCEQGRGRIMHLPTTEELLTNNSNYCKWLTMQFSALALFIQLCQVTAGASGVQAMVRPALNTCLNHSATELPLYYTCFSNWKTFTTLLQTLRFCIAVTVHFHSLFLVGVHADVMLTTCLLPFMHLIHNCTCLGLYSVPELWCTKVHCGCSLFDYYPGSFLLITFSHMSSAHYLAVLLLPVPWLCDGSFKAGPIDGLPSIECICTVAVGYIICCMLHLLAVCYHSMMLAP
jgi:hypothetical protein